MKNFKPTRYLILLMMLILTGAIAIAQEAESEEMKQKKWEEQMKQHQEEEEMMKAMQAEEMAEKKKMLEEQHQQMLQMEREYANQNRDMQRLSRESTRAAVRSNIVASDGDIFFVGGPQGSQSQLTLRKSFKETSSVSKGVFEVEAGITQVRCMINGSVRAGEIYIAIEYPDGKVFKEITINPSADINFNKSVSIKEEDQKKYKGNWTYVIKADKADGNYMVQIMTN